MRSGARLILRTERPFNAETPLDAQVGSLTPNPLHYVRNHFSVPAPPQQLAVDGRVRAPLELTLSDLRALPSRSLAVTLECAGNGRRFLDPPAPGEPWALGAVGTAEWTGVPLGAVLELARPQPDVREFLFRGADEGEVKDAGGRIAFERSLPAEHAWDEDVLLAYSMNGEPLPPEHGAPLRLVVPGRYGMASVKWLARITALDRPFVGFYQTDRYVIDGKPLGPVAPRAVITTPSNGTVLDRQPLIVAGYCWCGDAEIDRVNVSTDGGARWQPGRLFEPISRHAWRRWELPWTPSAAGEVVLLARAVTADGRLQPLTQVPSALGYANNQAQPVRVRVS